MDHKDKLVYAYQKKVNIEQQLTAEAGKHRSYYQTQLFKIVRELKMVEGHPKYERVFNAIHEPEDDLNYQR